MDAWLSAPTGLRVAGWVLDGGDAGVAAGADRRRVAQNKLVRGLSMGAVK